MEDWSWFLTLTVAGKMSARRLHGIFHEYCRAIATEVDDHILVAFALAPQPHSRQPHVHGVLGLPRGCTLRPEIGERRWRQMGYPCGDAVIRVYDDELGGIAYAAKQGELLLKVACPGRRVCRRTGGCRVAGGDIWRRDDFIALEHDSR